MKIGKFISTTMLVLFAAAAAPVYANSVAFGSDVLYSKPNLNKNLELGEYAFAKQHARYGSSFNDSWKFTVAADSTASISVTDLETNTSSRTATKSAKSPYPKRSSQRISGRTAERYAHHSINTSKIFDTKNLTFSLFDYKNQLIGTAGENGVLSNLNLVAGKWYTIQISGGVNGFFGSSYRGTLDCNLTPVPLGDTAPMLGSALALLALRLRKRTSIAA